MPDATRFSTRRRLAGALSRYVTGLLAAACFTSPLSPTPLAAQQRGGDPRQSVDELESPEVSKLTLRGVKAVDDDELRKSIATDESHCKSLIYTPFCLFSKSPMFYQHVHLDRNEFERDVLRIKVFYFKRGYRNAQVDTAVTRSGRNQVAVTFRITEGPPTLIESISLVQDTAVLPEKEAWRQLRVYKGRPLDLIKLDTSYVQLRQALWDRGYADATIDSTLAVDTASKTARVGITIHPKWQARIAEINVRREGEQRQVSDQTILNSLSVRPGDLYVRSAVLRSQRTLYESNLFSRASIIIPPQGDSLKLLEVTVREAPLREVRTTAGVSTADFGVIDGRFTNYNFLGGARRLQIQGAVGNLFARQLTGSWLGYDYAKNVADKTSYFYGDFDPFYLPTWRASVDLTQPWFLSPRNTLGANVFAHRRSAFGVFIDRGFGAQATFTRELIERAPTSFGYRYELTRVEAGDVYFCVNFGVCDVANIAALRRRQALSPLAIGAQMDRTSDPFSPTSGTRARLDLEHASAFTASDYRYNRAYADASTYRRVRHRGVLAFRVLGGWVGALGSTAQAVGIGPAAAGVDEAVQSSILHPRKRFYAGGSQSVRGFGENQLGPRILTIPASQLERIGCDLSTSAGIAACDPDATLRTSDTTSEHLQDKDFTPRPLGGNTLIGANVEYRFPIWQQLGGAVFVDAAMVSQGSLRDATKGTGAITPGFGVRYYSPVGPIRVDLGFNPQLTQDLVVVTEQVVNGKRQIVQLSDENRRTYAPAKTAGSFWSRSLNRLQLHLSIGQAF